MQCRFAQRIFLDALTSLLQEYQLDFLPPTRLVVLKGAQLKYSLCVQANDEVSYAGIGGIGVFLARRFGGRVGVRPEYGEEGFPSGLQGFQSRFAARGIGVHIHGMECVSLSVFRAYKSGHATAGGDLSQMQQVIDQ